LLTLHELAKKARGLDPSSFAVRFPRPSLVLAAAGALGLRESRVDTPPPGAGGVDGSTTLSAPMASPLLELSAKTPSPDDEDGSLVHWLEKSNRNPFTGMITIGRANNNDLVIPLPVISKLHAYVTPRPDGLMIFDQNSTNGTMVDGRRLEQGKGKKLEDGATIVLAPAVILRYYSPPALFGLLALRSSLGSK
jgi:hypothetical protein